MDLNWWKKLLFMLFPESGLFSSIKDRFFTKFVYSLGSAPKDAHDRSGQNFTDIDPVTTTRSDDWSEQFGAVGTLTTAQLQARWQETGGQSPNHLQSEMHEAGYTSVYVHEWWVPGSSPVTARNPILYINDHAPNNLFVNPVDSIYDERPQCGDSPDTYQCGDEYYAPGTAMYCGQSNGLKYEEKIYEHPDIAEQYPFYFYVCAQTWPEPAPLTPEEIQGIKRLIFKIKPIEQRCVLISTNGVYVNTPTTGAAGVYVNEPTTGADGVWVNLGSNT